MESISIEQMKVLLTELGAQHIQDISSNQSRKEDLITNTICHNISDGNMKLYYYHESYYFHCYTKCGENFNIFGLVMRNHKLKGIDLTFPEAISWICLKLGIKQSRYEKPDGFGHNEKGNSELDYLKKFDRKKPPEAELAKHSEQIFYMFSNHHHDSFLSDGINHESMDKYEIMFDYHRHKVIIPHRKHDDGSLIGIKTRSLNEWDIEAGFKYVPLKTEDVLYSYPTYANLYGYWQNKEEIKKHRKAIIVEAEKGVLQIDSMANVPNIGVGISGSNLSDYQIQLLLDLDVEEIMIALDREYEDLIDDKWDAYKEKVVRMARRINQFCAASIIFDSGNRIGYKDSPTDFGEDILLELIKERQYVNIKE